MAALLQFEMQPIFWGSYPAEFTGPNGTNTEGTTHTIFVQAKNLDETFTMGGKPLFTISNPQNQLNTTFKK